MFDNLSLRPVPFSRALFAVAVALGPGLLMWHLHGRWHPDGEYAYGWVVPVLAVYLFKLRWDDRPSASASPAAAGVFALVLVLLSLPARLLYYAAPERGVCAWSYAAVTVGTSLTLILLAGGWAWWRWLSFPFAFLLAAVPWPSQLEALVSDPLMRGTASATVEVLCLIGVPSTRSGHLVHIETGLLDIAEACSGIRSLQAMVMIALFLGELFRLPPLRRFWLMGIALGSTLVANAARTATLSYIGYKQGMNAVDQYHDSAGLTVLILSMAGALLGAFLLRSEPVPLAVPDPDPDTPPPPLIRPQFPLPLSVAVLSGLVVAEIFVETWYRLHERPWKGWSWAVEWPRERKDFHFIEIPLHSRQGLMCDSVEAATWTDPDSSECSLYWVRWNPGNPAAESAKAHRPDACLTGLGAVLESDFGVQPITVGKLQIPFRNYTFRIGEKTLYVFFLLQEEPSGGPAGSWNPEFQAMSVFQRASTGRRRSGEQSLEFAVSGYGSFLEAQNALKAHLPQLMRIAPGSSGAAIQ